MEIKKLVIASHNQGKVGEIREMLMPYGVEVVSAGELGLPDVEETATTFEGNAVLWPNFRDCLVWRTIPVCVSMHWTGGREFLPHVMRRTAILTRAWINFWRN